MKHIILGISGGIAAVKIPALVDILQKEKLEISVVMTKGAGAMLQTDYLEKKNITVYADLFKNPISTKKILKERKVEHTSLAGSANCIVVAPATANLLAKLACGIADDYLTTVILAAICPVILCPSMNVHMWENPATQKNIKILQSYGYQIIYPDSGLLACGYEGQGRLADIQVIKKAVLENIRKTSLLSGKKVVITAGGTIEPIDDVRFIANKSSGKMGASLAESAYLMGADVLVLRSKDSVKPRFNLTEKLFETAQDLEKLLKENLAIADICIHAAAVSDFAVKNKKKGKISSNEPIYLQLIPQRKILNDIKKFNPKVQLGGFKALFNASERELIQSARKSLKKSKADFIVANDVKGKDRGFEADTNEVWIVNKDGDTKHIPLASKTEIANQILKTILTGA